MKSTISKYFSAFNSMVGRWAVGIVVVGSFVVLQGCTAIQEPFHRLHYCNIGAVALTSVQIRYGQVTWPLTPEGRMSGGRFNCLSGVGISDSMPIPVAMYVTWKTEDGQEHKASVPVRSKLKSSYPLNTIEVRFNGDQLEVFEIVRPIATRELEFRLYP